MTKTLLSLVTMFLFGLGQIQSTGVIEGTVVDPSGKPVHHARVRVEPRGQASSGGHRLLRYYETDEKGNFAIDNLPWGEYLVLAGKQKDGYPDTTLAFYSNLAAPVVSISPAIPTVHSTVTLQPKAGRIVIKSVRDSLSRKDVENASVTLRRADHPNFFLTTAANFDSLLVPADTDVLIEVSAPNYQSWHGPASGLIHLRSEEKLALNVVLEPLPSVGNSAPK